METSTGPCILWGVLLLFTNWGEKISNEKRRQLKLGTHLAKLTPSKYLGPHQVSACWSSYYLSCLWYCGHILATKMPWSPKSSPNGEISLNLVILLSAQALLSCNFAIRNGQRRLFSFHLTTPHFSSGSTTDLPDTDWNSFCLHWSIKILQHCQSD